MTRTGLVCSAALGIALFFCTPCLANEKDKRAGFARPDHTPHPAGNRWSEARESLGRTLFFDPRLSRSGIISCATCHNPGFDYGDGLPRAVGEGMRTLGRRSPTLLNLAWAPALFWDGRADTLEDQAMGPIASPDEMNLTIEEMVARVRGLEGYAKLFARAYPNEPLDSATIAKAIANFERTLVSTQAPFDRFVEGDTAAISAEARRGFEVFTGEARCAECHSGWRLTDDSFHDIGLPGTDRGRGEHFAQIEVMQFAFKTPTLRNVDRRAPYMHDGSLQSLEEVVDHYDTGGKIRRPSLSPEMVPLKLSTADKRALLAFMRTLTSPVNPQPIPKLPR